MKQLAKKDYMHRDKIGFLPIKHMIEFDGGAFIPLPKFDEAERIIDNCKNRDGFIYPPTIVMKQGFSPPGEQKEIEWKDIPNTERPALLHKLPASHELSIVNYPIDDDFRKNDGAFLMYLASYLFGVRLQFQNCWFDGRVPIKRIHNISIDQQTASNFFSHSYCTWRKWPKDLRIRFTNILYVNSKAPSYEWDWERFFINYMVFDGLYKFAENNFDDKKTGHRKRLYKMCKHFGLACEKENLNKIWELRNNLFHECFWIDNKYGESEIQSDKNDIRPGRVFDVGFFQSQNLWRLNQRLIPAILGYDTKYISTTWSCMGSFKF